MRLPKVVKRSYPTRKVDIFSNIALFPLEAHCKAAIVCSRSAFPRPNELRSILMMDLGFGKYLS